MLHTLSKAATPGNVLPLRNSHATDALLNTLYDERGLECLEIALQAAFPTTVTSQSVLLILSSIKANLDSPSVYVADGSKFTGPIHKTFWSTFPIRYKKLLSF